ncbi:MAG: dTDP-4-dehydrorhamnose reductase [Candidatus Marinimicrobia bacterium]|nr:dTDP-4-dehydrorhamnose reductase [Candidatus Neomarinimicrobiota bacterium]MCF7851423.1 dTDP-4-dehydrorhamnose reductase [Candidatus Neomarinimicrobiota bacterium]MCF7904962.1 dTDP-4-dehydrorhamnose reductase [Candidatus Neomarinimicrobiota bacterium]
MLKWPNKKPKKLLITGANGMLGQNLVKEFSTDHEITGIDIGPSVFHDEAVNLIQLNLLETEALRETIITHEPEAIIHGAAYTNVDGAEKDADAAFRVNAYVPGDLARIANELDIPLIHISTDYVFSGDNGPYRESDACDPQGIYARSKYEGEETVRNIAKRSAIIRPNVLYGHGYDLKSSFVDWLIFELKEGNAVNIVTDQFSNPTYARRLAVMIRIIIANEAWDTWHFGAKEVVSRFDFAQQVADVFGLRTELIHAISTSDLNQAAPRPMKCGLICDKIEEKLGVKILSIQEELELLKEELHAS